MFVAAGKWQVLPLLIEVPGIFLLGAFHLPSSSLFPSSACRSVEEQSLLPNTLDRFSGRHRAVAVAVAE